MDTDIFYDVDDAGALAIANALQDRGEARLLAVMVNSHSRWGAPAADAIDTYYHHGDVPVGTIKPVDDTLPAPFPPYERYLAEHFPNSLRDGSRAPDAVALYRQILARQPDHSVVIASIGYLTNLANLLGSRPDQYSALPGAQLVSRKVKLLAVMGGQYPAGAEFNFISDPAATQRVVSDWPTRVVFDGQEVGFSVNSGSGLSSQTPASNPVRAAYEMYVGAGNSHWSFDLTDVYFAVRGTAGLFGLAGDIGSNQVVAGGANSYLPAPDKDQNYLVKTAPDATIGQALDRLLVQTPTALRPAGLTLLRVRWRARTLKLTGRGAANLTSPLAVVFRCARKGSRRTTMVRRTRWHAWLSPPGACSRSHRGNLTISYPGDTEHAAAVIKRRVRRGRERTSGQRAPGA